MSPSSGLAVNDMLSFSWDKTKRLLFPFNFKRWLKILIIVWLAGVGGSGSGNNFNYNKPAAKPAANQEQVAAQTDPQTKTETATVADSTQTPQAVPGTSPAPSTSDPAPKFPLNFPWIPVVIGFSIFMIAMLFFWSWLNARFNFILLDVMTGGDASVSGNIAILESFKHHQEQGNSYFWWSMGFFGIVLAAFGLFGFLGFLVFLLGKTNVLLAILAGIVLAIAFMVALFWIWVIGAVVSDFVLPIMYQDKIKTMEACRRFLELKTQGLGSVVKYLLILLGLGILAGILQMLVGLVILLIAFVIGFAFFLVGWLLVSVAAFLKPVLFIVGIILAIPGIVAVAILGGMATLPIPVFFKAFALSYLTRLIPQYDLLNFLKERAEPAAL